MINITLVPLDEIPPRISALDRATREWTDKAARGECAWVCSDCCYTFNAEMPDKCEHGIQQCTDILTRDKRRAIGVDNGG